MSQENVEIVKRLQTAFNAKDHEAFAELTTPDFEWTTSMAAVEGVNFLDARGSRRTSRGCAKRGMSSGQLPASISILASASSSSDGFRDGDAPAACPSTRPWTSCSIFAGREYRASAHFSTTPRHCEPPDSSGVSGGLIAATSGAGEGRRPDPGSSLSQAR